MAITKISGEAYVHAHLCVSVHVCDMHNVSLDRRDVLALPITLMNNLS